LALMHGKALKDVIALMTDVHGFSARYSTHGPVPCTFQLNRHVTASPNTKYSLMPGKIARISKKMNGQIYS
jgi:hypothetical protein